MVGGGGGRRIGLLALTDRRCHTHAAEERPVGHLDAGIAWPVFSVGECGQSFLLPILCPVLFTIMHQNHEVFPVVASLRTACVGTDSKATRPVPRQTRSPRRSLGAVARSGAGPLCRCVTIMYVQPCNPELKVSTPAHT